MRYGLIGAKLGHSFSKELHEALGRYTYELKELPPEELAGFLARRDFAGINVTIPYKETVLPYLDQVSPRAASVGAVNTVVNRQGRLWGDNTDLGGLTALLRRVGVDLRGKTVLICGTGGTSKTALAAVKDLGAGRVLRLSRTGREGALTYQQARQDCAGAEFLINTTPVGMYPDTDAAPVDLAGFPALEGVADVVYNPLTTALVRQARARGLPAENGLYMLVAQAVLAAEDFTGESFPEGTVPQLYHRLLRQKQNIVLLGMPGAGKTTLGRLLAERLGREAADSDALTAARAGVPVPELIRTRGESAFRELETAALRELSVTGGKIIATGGGAVLRRENVDALRMNGVLVFLDRPPDALPVTPDRPLSDTREKLAALYAARRPLYAAAADVTVPVTGTPEDTANLIIEELGL